MRCDIILGKFICNHYCYYLLLTWISYAILAPGAIPSGMFMDGRKAAAKLVDALQLEANEFRMGTTKVSIYLCEQYKLI